MTLVHQIEKTSRRRDQNMDSVAQRPDLRPNGGAAINHRRAQAQMAAVGSKAVIDLVSQFTCRRQYQRMRLTAPCRTSAFREAVQQRQSKGGRLASAGLGNAQQIVPFEQRRNGFELDGSWGGVAFVKDRAKDRLGQCKARKVGHVCDIFLKNAVTRRPECGMVRVQAQCKQCRLAVRKAASCRLMQWPA